MVKPTKIDDVKRPEKVAPATTSRPILVTNRPVLTNDPMMVADGKPDADGEKANGEVINRTAKTIKPIAIKSDLPEENAPEKKPDKALDEAAATSIGEAAADKTEAETQPEETAEQQTRGLDAKPEVTEDTAASNDEPRRDSEAEVNAEELAAAEAKAAREQKLEAIIASGKYRVPINAVQRKRSHMYTMLLCLLAIVLALLLLDAMLDTGLIKPPAKLPHTHFFSTT